MPAEPPAYSWQPPVTRIIITRVRRTTYFIKRTSVQHRANQHKACWNRRPRGGLPKNTEAFSRVLIDQALRDSGWDLLDPHRVRFECTGDGGCADYVLLGKHGPLCVLEAKRP